MKVAGQLWQCSLCGCVVAQRDRHDVFHQCRNELCVFVPLPDQEQTPLVCVDPRRWEDGFRNVATVFVGVKKPFEISEIVDQVKQMKQRLVEVTRANEDLQAANGELEQRLVAAEQQASGEQSVSIQPHTSTMGADLAAATARAEAAEAALAELREVGRAVLDRWDSPKWKDQPHTGEVINRLRAVIDEAGKGSV